MTEFNEQQDGFALMIQLEQFVVGGVVGWWLSSAPWGSIQKLK